MNAQYSNVFPLPSVLDAATTPTAPRRRRSIGHFRLNGRDLEGFNQLLTRLGRSHAPLDCDQLVTAARELTVATGQTAHPCIQQRLQWADSVAQMVSDPDWLPANDAAAPAELVLDYLRGHEDLIPDWLPRIGRLDDAIVIETAWSGLAPEVESYIDFRRLRRVEAQLCGCPETGLAFTRKDWEQARKAEVVLIAHQRRVRESSYLPVPAGMFRIH